MGYVFLVILLLVAAVVAGMYLYKRHGDHIEDVVDKVEEKIDEIKNKD